MHVFTDGACSNNGRADPVAGIGVHWPDFPERDIAEPVRGDKHTNNVAELQAVGRALEDIQALLAAEVHSAADTFVIWSDSTYTLKALTEWWSLWKLKGFPAKIQNLELITAVQGRLEALGPRVQLRYVRGHGDSKGNQRADFLARQGALKVKT